MFKKAKTTLWLMLALILLCLVTAFVPVLNPVIVSVNNCNEPVWFPELMYNMDGLYPPINAIDGGAYASIGFYMPFGTLLFLVFYGFILASLTFKLIGNEKLSAALINASSWLGLVFGGVFIGIYAYYTATIPYSVQFPIGSAVIVVLCAAVIIIRYKYKKQVEAEDTRAKYMKTIFTKAQKREALIFYCMVSPFYIMACIVTLYPILWGVLRSFTNYTGYNDPQSVGFSSYMRCLQDEETWTSFVTTLEIGIFYVPVGLILGVALAMLLNTNIKGDGFFRTVYYFPSIIPAVATGLMWRLLFAQNNGAINVMLGWFGVEPFNWLGYNGCRYALYIMLAWGSAGGILTYLSALKGISNELYESAMIDGASPWKRFWSITVPMISSTLFYNLVTGLINAWQVYQQPVFLAGATMLTVPYTPNYTFVVQIYQQIFTNQRFGFGLAMVWILFAASMITNRVIFWTGNLWVFNENAPQKEKKKKTDKVKKQKAVVAGN